KADMAVANSGENDISVFLGHGDGTFAAAATYPVGAAPLDVAVGDFDGDGKPDLVTANSHGGTVSVLLNRGDGTFSPAVTSTAGAGPSAIAVADFNGDGRLDGAT